MNPENKEKLWRHIAAAGSAAVAKNGYVTAIDALLGHRMASTRQG